MDSTKSDNINNIDENTIDLDPITDGIQTTFSSTNGTWSLSDGDVTFTSKNDFYGTEVIYYTIQDNYILDEKYSPATSEPVKLTVNIVSPIKTYTLKDIYIRKNDANVALSLSGSQIGVNYQLQNNYDNSNIGDLVAGTGGIIKFPVSTTDATYKVVASNPIYPYCNGTLINSASVIIITKIDFHNTFSPNNDNVNDFLKISGIENYPNNAIAIYDRLGSKVYSVSEYDNNTKKFEGISNNRASININKKLPIGVYYYILDLGVKGKKILNGWIYIQR